MDRPAPESAKADPETLQALADEIVKRQSSIQNYVVNVAIDLWLLRRLGLEPLCVPGRLVAWIFHFLTVLVPAVAFSAIAGDGSGAALASWIVVGAVWAGIFTMAPLFYGRAIPNHLSWLSAIVEEGDLHRVMAWCKKWYRLRVVAPVAGVLTLGTVLSFYLLAVRDSGVPVPAGSLYAGAYFAFMVMQNAYALSMMTGEAYNLTTCRYELYRLSPADSVVVRRSLQGYSQLAAVNVLATTASTFFILLLLPTGSDLTWPVLLFPLLLLYLSTGMGVMFPRVVLGRIIRLKKEAEMEVLQAQIDELVPRVRELSADEYEEMTRLQKVHDTIRDSPENLLPLGAILRTVGALALSTATILVTAFAQEWISGLARRLFP